MEKASPIYLRLKDAFGGLNDVRLGAELGVTKQAVSQWRAGKTEPSEAVLLTAQEKTGLSYKWFLTGDRQHLEEGSGKAKGEAEENKVVREYESLFREVTKLNPEQRAKFDAIMDYAEHQVAQMLKEQGNESPRSKGKKS
jgi:transcriptional regulator with XRE-family HTH domain